MAKLLKTLILLGLVGGIGAAMAKKLKGGAGSEAGAWQSDYVPESPVPTPAETYVPDVAAADVVPEEVAAEQADAERAIDEEAPLDAPAIDEEAPLAEPIEPADVETTAETPVVPDPLTDPLPPEDAQA